ncbi:protein-glutamate O-methyltransferase [Rhodobacter ferrooxidans]|uniref:Chemotaxis protein methyltransferase n=1 Tax=Rhodobacter ferrooxidans TaxID=371731 RepID=C8S4D3_9RHOB|nr:protein-glutamate O-methyltransferase [Rhodobacter sp. SW2]EEW24192.1 MCP methyltransferase, CheR-type [Rhodobacter sp. SW2]
MNPAAASTPPFVGGVANYGFSDADFAVIARRAQMDFGLHLTVVKKDLVYSRLTKRLRQLGLTDFASYCRLIESDAGADERMAMLSALTTNVTHFFREEHHFQTLRETVLPPLIKAARAGGRVRLWSAGCSAGQEPYSLAFILLDLCPEAARLNIRVLATDVDPVILVRAKAGIYENDELKAISPSIRAQHLDTVAGQPNCFSIGAKAREIVTFGELNLMQDWPIRGPFEVLFCRNVAIYFDKATQSRLWSRFAELITVGGHLFIGHSERVSGPATASLEAVGVTTYRKTPGESGNKMNIFEGVA